MINLGWKVLRILVEKQEVKLVYLTGQYIYDVFQDCFVDVKMKANYNSCVLIYYSRSMFCMYFINLHFALLTHLKTNSLIQEVAILCFYFFTLNLRNENNFLKQKLLKMNIFRL